MIEKIIAFIVIISILIITEMEIFKRKDVNSRNLEMLLKTIPEEESIKLREFYKTNQQLDSIHHISIIIAIIFFTLMF